MKDACTLSNECLLDYGSYRNLTETVFLYECRDDVTTHSKIVFVASTPERIRGHPAKGWPRPFVS